MNFTTVLTTFLILWETRVACSEDSRSKGHFFPRNTLNKHTFGDEISVPHLRMRSEVLYYTMCLKLSNSGCWTESENWSERMEKATSNMFLDRFSISVWHLFIWKYYYIQLHSQCIISVVHALHGCSVLTRTVRLKCQYFITSFKILSYEC